MLTLPRSSYFKTREEGEADPAIIDLDAFMNQQTGCVHQSSIDQHRPYLAQARVG
jgi:hypothetical protein